MRKYYKIEKNGYNELMNKDTSWEKDSQHYNKQVGREGHYYHQQVVIPGVVRLLDLKVGDKLLDVGCGQGVLARAIDEEVEYWGVDASRSLIEMAIKFDKNNKHHYQTIKAERMVFEQKFEKIAAVLSLQNMAEQEEVLRKISALLEKDGKFVMVINHPCFRIPRQSGWGEHDNKLQYRYVDRYMSEMEIPILMHPGQRDSAKTWSYHKPLSFYSEALNKAEMG